MAIADIPSPGGLWTHLAIERRPFDADIGRRLGCHIWNRPRREGEHLAGAGIGHVDDAGALLDRQTAIDAEIVQFGRPEVRSSGFVVKSDLTDQIAPRQIGMFGDRVDPDPRVFADRKNRFARSCGEYFFARGAVGGEPEDPCVAGDDVEASPRRIYRQRRDGAEVEFGPAHVFVVDFAGEFDQPTAVRDPEEAFAIDSHRPAVCEGREDSARSFRAIDPADVGPVALELMDVVGAAPHRRGGVGDVDIPIAFAARVVDRNRCRVVELAGGGTGDADLAGGRRIADLTFVGAVRHAVSPCLQKFTRGIELLHTSAMGVRHEDVSV